MANPLKLLSILIFISFIPSSVTQGRICDRYPYLVFCQKGVTTTRRPPPPPRTTPFVPRTTRNPGNTQSGMCQFYERICARNPRDFRCALFTSSCGGPYTTTQPPATTPPSNPGQFCSGNQQKFGQNCLQNLISADFREFCPSYIRACVAPQQPCLMKEMMTNGYQSEQVCFDNRGGGSNQGGLCSEQRYDFERKCTNRRDISVNDVRFCVLYADICNEVLEL